MNFLSGIFFFLFYAVISCTGLYWLKSANNWLTVKFIMGASFYVLGAGIWLYILRIYPLSIAFPIASGTLMIGTTIVGYLMLNENVTWIHLIGLLLTFSGISLLALQVK